MELDRIDLNKLYTFFAIAERGGVAAAARRLGRTPSAVSQSLSALEGSLDVRLFDRVGRRLVLTREGRTLRARFHGVQEHLQRAIDEIRNASGEVRGQVHVGLFPGFPAARLGEIVSGFTSRHPHARVRIRHGTQDQLTRSLLGNRLDFVVSFQPRSAVSPHIDSERLFEHELVLVSGRSFFRRGFGRAELARTPVIDYYQSNPLIHRWLRHHRAGSPDAIEVRVWAATTDLVVDLILRGAGVGVVPLYLAEPLARRRRLRIVRTGRDELRDAAWLNEIRRPYRPLPLSAFREAVLAEFAESGQPPRSSSRSRPPKPSGGSAS